MTSEAAAPADDEYPSRGARIRSWVRFALISLARGVLATVAVTVLWTVLPLVIGWSSAVVTSGSMLPRIRPGDVVVAQPFSGGTVEPGQPILAENPDKPGHLIMHRVVGRNPDGTLVTKGDANEQEDSTPMPLASVKARPRILVRYVGLPALWFQQGRYREVSIFVAGAGLLGIVATRRHEVDHVTSEDENPAEAPIPTEAADAPEPQDHTEPSDGRPAPDDGDAAASSGGASTGG
ncbi:signal peptidase I [Actinoplanes sp. NEAU-A12]|uniref:Signal peptidase I n=1 Tax=Actinoplanes sandaracinus TaxID=3045177 RepID=A0ABT6WBD4_9ACTN|nr:signal peptidase I [Actinoplanes sandaracinus]